MAYDSCQVKEEQDSSLRKIHTIVDILIRILSFASTLVNSFETSEMTHGKNGIGDSITIIKGLRPDCRIAFGEMEPLFLAVTPQYHWEREAHADYVIVENPARFTFFVVGAPFAEVVLRAHRRPRTKRPAWEALDPSCRSFPSNL